VTGAAAVPELLRHLGEAGFTGTPGAADDGPIAYPRPWSDEGVWSVGRLLRELHTAAESFRLPAGFSWTPWWMHEDADGPDAVIGHCDAGPWHTVARDGLAVAFLGWDVAGPVNRWDEVAATAVWNAYLRDDDIAERYGLPGVAERARHVRLFLDGYRTPAAVRRDMVTRMIEVTIRDCAAEAIEAGITPDSTDPTALWSLAWRARAAAWMIRHRDVLARQVEC